MTEATFRRDLSDNTGDGFAVKVMHGLIYVEGDMAVKTCIADMELTVNEAREFARALLGAIVHIQEQDPK